MDEGHHSSEHQPALNLRKSRVLHNSEMAVLPNRPYYEEKAPFQRKGFERLLSQEKLPKVLASKDNKIEATKRNVESNLSLTFLPAIKVHPPSTLKLPSQIDKLGHAGPIKSRLASPMVIDKFSKKQETVDLPFGQTEELSSISSKSRDHKADKSLVSQLEGTPKLSKFYIQAYEPANEQLESAQERMVKKIKRFLPDNPSIEERMVESSKRSAQEQEAKRLSQQGQTSGSNENSSLRNVDRTDNMNITKGSDGKLSQPVKPGYSDPNAEATVGHIPNKNRSDEKEKLEASKSGTQGSYAAGFLSVKRKQAQTRRSEGPLTRRETERGLQDTLNARRGSTLFALTDKMEVLKSNFSPKMKELFHVQQKEVDEKVSSRSSIKRDSRQLSSVPKKPDENLEQRQLLSNQRSQAGFSCSSDRSMKSKTKTDHIIKPKKEGISKKRPESSSDDESDLRFISYSDD